jgi:hypothetical protein
MGSRYIGSPERAKNTLNYSKIKGQYWSLNSANQSSFTTSLSIYCLAGFQTYWHLNANHYTRPSPVIKGKSTLVSCQGREAEHVGSIIWKCPLVWKGMQSNGMLPLCWVTFNKALHLHLLSKQSWGMWYLPGVQGRTVLWSPSMTCALYIGHTLYPSWLRYQVLFCLVVTEGNRRFSAKLKENLHWLIKPMFSHSYVWV